MERIELINRQPLVVVEISISTKGIRTWTVKCRGDDDAEVFDRATKMDSTLTAQYGDPANLS